MPSVDLRPLFTPPDDDPQRSPTSPVVTENPPSPAPLSVFTKLRFTGPQLANLGFVVAACLGAIFSAAYLFKGDELFHEVAAWPRELFSGRPAVIAQRQDNNDIADVIAAIPDPATLVANTTNTSGGPFSSSSKLLGLESPPASMARPNEWPSNPSGDSAFPATNSGGLATDSALTSNPVRDGAAALPPNAVGSNNLSTAAQSASSSARQSATAAANSMTARAARSANRANGIARTAATRSATRAANVRAAHMSPFRRAMATIARTLGTTKAQKATRRGQNNGRVAQADRGHAKNIHRALAQRSSKMANRTASGARSQTAKHSNKSAGSRNLPPPSRIAARSAVMSGSNGTMGAAGLSRGGGSAIRSFGPSNLSGSDGGFRSLGSMGGGRGFGGGGGMGMGGRGLGRGR